MRLRALNRDEIGVGLRVIVTQPTDEPLTLAEAKLHLKDDGDGEDDLIKRAIATAREQAEKELNRPLLPQTCSVALDSFPSGKILLWNDVTSLVSVTYIDEQGEPQILPATSYRLRSQSYVVPLAEWPKGDTVTVQFKCGAWGQADAIPSSIRNWMLLMIGTLVMQRESESTDQTFEMPSRFTAGLLDSYRMPVL